MLINAKMSVSLVLVFVLIVNLILFGMQKVSVTYFWVSMLLIYLVSKYVINKKE